MDRDNNCFQRILVDNQIFMAEEKCSGLGYRHLPGASLIISRTYVRKKNSKFKNANTCKREYRL